MTAECDHDDEFHWQLLVDASQGRLRHCPTCGADAVRKGRYAEWGPPSRAWLDANPEARADADLGRIEGDWSKPRMIPWLPWNHPDLYVTSHREAMQVCRRWGIDPEVGGFISETHRKAAFTAAARNTRNAIERLSPAARARVRATRQAQRPGRR